MNDGRIIADTNIVSYLMKGTDLGQRYKRHLAGKIVGIVFVTVAAAWTPLASAPPAMLRSGTGECGEEYQ